MDVSDGGLSFQAVAPVQRAEKVEFLLSLRGHSRIEGTGEVVWTDPLGTICGLKFTSLSVGALEHLNNWTNQSHMANTPPATEMDAREKSAAATSKIFSDAYNAERSLPTDSPIFAIAPVVEAQAAEPGPGFRGQHPLLFWTAFGILIAAIGLAGFIYGVQVEKTQIRAVLQSPATSAPQANPPIVAGTSVPAAPGAIETKPVPDEMRSPRSDAPTVASRPLTSTSKLDAVSGSAQRVAGKEGIGKVAPGQSSAPTEDGGKSELAAALAQLNGQNGKRDNPLAVVLLWAAIRKGNITAEVTLADLYIYGDGVKQNCDQGRTLLMAASKSGDVQARLRLADLIAKGCPR